MANQLQINMSSFVNELSMFSPVKGKTNSLNPEDNFNQLYVTPCGIFSLNDEFDYEYAFVNLATAKKLFNEPNRISAIEISCEKGKQENAQEKLTEMLGENFIIRTDMN